jgi:uncharacterized phiE125 gp8 family phage protein
MPLNTNALVNLAETKVWLDIPSSDTAQDALVEGLINSATAQIEKYCARAFKRLQRTELYDGRSSDLLLLTHYPAEKPLSIKVFGNELDQDSFGLQDEMTVKLVSGNVFPSGSLNVEVTYFAGYASIPDDLQTACKFLVQWLYNIRSDRRVGIQSKGKQSEQISFIQGMPKEVVEMISPYTRMEFPSVPGSVVNL